MSLQSFLDQFYSGIQCSSTDELDAIGPSERNPTFHIMDLHQFRMKKLPLEPARETLRINKLSVLKQVFDRAAVDEDSYDVPCYRSISISLDRDCTRYICSSDAKANARGKVALTYYLELQRLRYLSDEDIRKLGKFFADRIAVPGDGINVVLRTCRFRSYDAIVELLNCLPRFHHLISDSATVDDTVGKWLVYDYKAPTSRLHVTSSGDLKLALQLLTAHERTHRICAGGNKDGVTGLCLSLVGCFRYDDSKEIERLVTDHRMISLTIDLRRCTDKRCKGGCPTNGGQVIMQSLTVLKYINDCSECRLHREGMVQIYLPQEDLFQHLAGIPRKDLPFPRASFVEKILGEPMIHYRIEDGTRGTYV